MRKKLFMLSFIAAVAIAAVVGKKTFGSHENKSYNLLMKNIEALSQGENSKYPRYINHTDKNKYKDFKVEIEGDTTGGKITTTYSRNCTTYYTYCKQTGKNDDICHGELNGMVTDCGVWSKEE